MPKVPESLQEPHTDGGGKPDPLQRLWWPLLLVFILLGYAAIRWSTHRAALRPLGGAKNLSALAAQDWVAAVHRGDRQAAVNAAARLVPGPFPAPFEAYRGFVESNNIPAAFLEGSFTDRDAIYWEDLYYFRELTARVPAQPTRDGDAPEIADAELLAVSGFVRAHIAGEEPVARNAWPRDIWERGYGVCDRLCWVAAELLYQRGYDVAIVYLHDNPEYQNSPHTVLAVRRGERAWVMDLLMGRILADCSVDTLAEQAALRERLWPERPDWQRSMGHALLLTPSNPLDYCPRTPLLAERLHALGVTDLPRFGRDPLERQRAFQSLREATRGGPPLLPITPWTHPLRMLSLDLRLADLHIRKGSPTTPPENPPPPGLNPAPTVILARPGTPLPAPAKGD